jgi:hypothetical protein
MLAAVREFQDEYDAPVDFLLAGDTVRGSKPIQQVGDGVI